MNLAERIRDYVRQEDVQNADTLTVANIAEAMGEYEPTISFVLTHFLVQEDDTIVYIGPGGGGGWIPVKERTPEEVLADQLNDKVISQQEYDDRIELVKRGKNPRDHEAMAELYRERENAAEES